MPAPGPVTFTDGCRALDSSLLSARLATQDTVTELVQQLHLPSLCDLEQQTDGGPTNSALRPPWLTRAAEDTWQVLEVMRSSIGEWQTDSGQEHEEPAALGQKLRADTTTGLQPTLSRKLSQQARLLKPRRLSLRRDGSIGSQDMEIHTGATSTGQRPWHLQEQGKFHRVLYRPGEEGTPFHTMLLEGVISSSVGTALSICWEAPYYPQWWPQFSVPTFKVTESLVAAEINRYHNLCVSRIKVPWPFATREIGVSSRLAFVDPSTGTALVSISTMPEDPRRCSESLTGYAPDKIPKVPQGTVRLGVEGGYLLKELGPDTCFFRAFVTVDMKLDVVPVWVINFINRTLAGTGFQVLSQVVKDVVSGKKGIGTTFQKLLAADNTIYKEVDRILTETRPRVADVQPPHPEVIAPDTGKEAPLAEEQKAADTEREQLTSPPLVDEANTIPLSAGNLPSLAARDQEMSEALNFLDEVILQVKSDSLSVFSESHESKMQHIPALNGNGSTGEVDSALEISATDGKKLRKRWWNKLRFRKMSALGE